MMLCTSDSRVMNWQIYSGSDNKYPPEGPACKLDLRSGWMTNQAY